MWSANDLWTIKSTWNIFLAISKMSPTRTAYNGLSLTSLGRQWSEEASPNLISRSFKLQSTRQSSHRCVSAAGSCPREYDASAGLLWWSARLKASFYVTSEQGNPHLAVLTRLWCANSPCPSYTSLSASKKRIELVQEEQEQGSEGGREHVNLLYWAYKNNSFKYLRWNKKLR